MRPLATAFAAAAAAVVLAAPVHAQLPDTAAFTQ